VLPWAAHWYYWNTLGNTPGENYYNVDEILVTIPLETPLG
jgi:hypothetical protein